jgi:Zn-dependent protease with chaperone function
MGPDRTFGALLGLAVGGGGLLGAAAFRFLRAGVPPAGQSAQALTWHGVLLPGPGDLLIHLISYGLLGLLLGGALRALGRAALSVRRTRRFIAAAPAGAAVGASALHHAGGRAGLGGRIDLLADARPRAFCYGLRRPRVAITAGMLALLDEGELEAVLRHEAYHAANRDPLRLVAANALAAIFFFLPLLALLRDHYAVATELAADRHAIRGMGTDRDIAAALYKLLSHPECPLPAAAVGATSVLPLRVDALLDEAISVRPRLRPGVLLGTAVGAAGLALLLVVPLSLFAGNGLLLQQHLAAILC